VTRPLGSVRVEHVAFTIFSDLRLSAFYLGANEVVLSYLGFLGCGACRSFGCLGGRPFLSRTPLILPGRLLRKRLLARNVRCFPLGSSRLARVDDPPPLFLPRLSYGIVGSGGCTEFLE
jgi:hypothetical protein